MSGNVDTLLLYEDQARKKGDKNRLPFITYLMSGKSKGEDLKRIKEFINVFTFKEKLDSEGNTVMHYACMYGDKESVVKLKVHIVSTFQRGSQALDEYIHISNNRGLIPIQMALLHKNLRALKGFSVAELVFKKDQNEKNTKPVEFRNTSRASQNSLSIKL